MVLTTLAWAPLLVAGWAVVTHAVPAPQPGAGHAQAVVERWAGGDALDGTKVGVAVQCTSNDALWATHGADRLMNPASGTKLVTTAAALELLAPDVAWPTTAHGVLREGGDIDGDLVIVGRGDPQLMGDDLDALVSGLVAAGVKRVSGDLVVDASRFDEALLPPAYDQKSTDAAYRPTISAAGTNYNAIAVSVRPGKRLDSGVRVSIEPKSSAVIVKNTATTKAGAAINELQVSAEALRDGRTRVVVSGALGIRAKRQRVRKRVADPGVLTAHVLARRLTAAGIRIGGGARLGADCPCATAPELARVDSASLAATLADMNTWSNNAIAETLFKQLGRRPDGRGKATWDRAQRRVADALRGLGVDHTQLRVVNGSGLYKATMITPRAMVGLLDHFAQDTRTGAIFRDSLAVSGEAGTLRRRLRDKRVRGRVRAKTGTLDEVTSISGFVPSKSGCLLAFSIMVNESTADRTEALRKAADALILQLAQL